MKKKNLSKGFKNLKREKFRYLIRKFVEIAVKNTLTKKTSTGLVELIEYLYFNLNTNYSQNMGEKCGGVVVELNKKHQGVDSVNMNVKKMKTLKIWKKVLKIIQIDIKS